jgi:hypothetical protein
VKEREDRTDALAGDCAILSLMIAQLERWDFSDQEQLDRKQMQTVLDAKKRMTENLKGQLTFKRKLIGR